ncbi:MAG TPA: ceramidase domain-containing protein [Burkholderiales bacterium]|nr:ceramidase domain-containing protein [Burkholderiales bacterium]
MDPWARLDLYCERTDPGFWAEPANALTNVAFLIAAAAVWYHAAGASPPRARDARMLAALIGLIGVGSFLFHTLAVVWAAWLDQGAIALYIYAFLWLFLARVAGLPWWGALGGLGVFAMASRALTAPFPPGSLNGSYAYFPALLALGALAAYAWRRRHAAAGALAAAAGVFVVAIVLRSIDQTACEAWPLGTHFLWHCLIALVAYLTATALRPPVREAA